MKEIWQKMDETFCGKCNKICYGEVLEAHGEFFHQNCFKCKACLRELMTNGFFLFENEFYCTNDYNKLFGIKCAGCDNFIEGESISILDDSFHEECFICATCRTPFPPGAKVNLNGNDYICENCVQGVDGAPPPVQTQEGTCAGCGNDIKSGQALLALERQWHLWCFTCNKCGCLLSGEYMGRDGVPFCEKDYQDEFGVSCAGCGGFITGKVLQAGEKHYHPQCSRCAKCGQMFGEGEEMYLQGSEIWHPQCSDEYQREAEENERLAYQEQQAREEEERKERERQELEKQRKEQEERELREREERERAEREKMERERAEWERAERERAERERAERERADRERAERERAERERAERERAEREREERERAEKERVDREAEERAKVEQKFYRRPPPESKSTENLAYSAKPFGAQKTTPSSISINFKPKTTQPSAGRWKPPEPSEPAKSAPLFRPSQYPRTESPRLTDPPATTTKTTTEIKTYSVRTEEKRSFSPPTTQEEKQPPVQNGFNKASSVSSDEGAPARPPPPPARGAASQNWKSRVSTSSYSVKRATSPPSTQELKNDSAYPPVNVEIDVRSANKPMSFVDSATRRNDPYQPDSKTNITIKSVSKTTDDTPVSSAVYRRLPNRDRDQLREHRKSLPAMSDYNNFSEPPRMRENGPSSIEAKAFNRRSLPSVDRYEDVPQGQKASTTYPYHVLKSTNYKMPKEIDRSRLEIYLSDEDFESIFNMERDDFYKQPAWKQRDLKKKKSHLWFLYLGKKK
eukprot:Seg2645.3 transcript_id=Seg2645.3/GoldUCD/mRNA.D3Y31 product="Actin-binding LIM protein 1" protein_id=Seg2645.3/GoldUCD/D3Y31